MAVTAEYFFGGAVNIPVTTFTGDFILNWSPLQRVVRLVPNVDGHEITLKAANSPEIPFGNNIWILLSRPGGVQTFTVVDAEGDISPAITIAAGDGCKIHKYLNSSGLARFTVDKRAGA